MAAFLRPLILVTFVAFALPGCDSGPTTEGDSTVVRFAGKAFTMEIADTNEKRVKGLGGREYIDPETGMVFVFQRAATQQFVMRDCPIPIDIVFLDSGGRVLVSHAMTPEEPQGAAETDLEYDARLKRYSSRFPARFALEFAGGTLETLEFKVGDVVDMDLEGLKRRAR